jgi:pimeloyl-ACP methyl ester carboxylesterase
MEPISIEFLSGGECVHGRFFTAVGTQDPTTLLLVPGWPGNPDDVLDLGVMLSKVGINVCMFNPRGLHKSGGIVSHANTLQDIGTAWQWLRQFDIQKQFKVDTTSLVLGGYSFGGGMAMAFAAREPSVRRVVSIAGADFGEVGRLLQSNPTFNRTIRDSLWSTRAPEGPARFDVEAIIQEVIDHPDVYGLRENAVNLANREILLFGGWEDEEAPIELFPLPLYRSLKKAGAANVTFIVYHTDHSFSNMRQKLATDTAEWLNHQRNGN